MRSSDPMLKISDHGLTLGTAIMLSAADKYGRIEFDQERCGKILQAAYDHQLPSNVLPVIRTVVDGWNRGERHAAHVRICQIELPKPIRADRESLNRVLDAKWLDTVDQASAKAMTSAPAYLTEPRVPKGSPGLGGRWTKPGTNTSSETLLIAESPAIAAKKRNFIMKYYEETAPFAEKLNVPIEFLLGLAAKESGFGSTRFAQIGNNPIGMQSKPPRQLDPDAKQPLQALGDSAVFEATFNSYTECLQAFSNKYGDQIRGMRDPLLFGKKLQKDGHFGYKNGMPDPGYASELANVITNLKPHILEYENAQE